MTPPTIDNYTIYACSLCGSGKQPCFVMAPMNQQEIDTDLVCPFRLMSDTSVGSGSACFTPLFPEASE